MEIHGFAEPRFTAVREAFAGNIDRYGEIGAAVCVYYHGRPVVDLWAGMADPDAGRPWRRDTPQVVFSATKGVVAACAHLLVQRGDLDLDAPVARYWPEFAAAGKDRIPVRWVLSHRSGVAALDRPLSSAEVTAWDPVTKAVAAQAPAWEPGTAHGYHAFTYGWIVGELVRRVSGRGIGTFLREEIADPFGLDVWIGLPDDEQHRASRIVAPPLDLSGLDRSSLVVRALLSTDEPLDLNRPDLRAAEIPAVNAACTAHALARFYAALAGPVDGRRILDPATLAAATAEQAAGVDRILGTPTRWALGFGLPTPDVPWFTPTLFGHAGHGGSLGFADPASGLAFGYVMNRIHSTVEPDRRASDLAVAAQAAAR
ncbi:serine hydrolase domain-containing protein [Phytohabitans sp. ZYX-F-186]|uniref:Serine hydrolase domain-containing protein n=1 Tax=Phytohabitans maris TaxID=3071409 RepID=A0ABU0ZM93_9ACTN|nr:serine hydrolase domain-containing protein [Phytohabitans sp. ZYX-F-186]MDQ7908110.1 serine hydrolase domain-containing protein [Phytohabitans sp. ZYX-F-186]